MPTKRKQPKNETGVQVVHVAFLIDESGSMHGREEAVITGYNQFITDLRKDKTGGPVRATLSLFDLSPPDDVVRHRFVDEPLDAVSPLIASDYNPRGSTPLLDATVKTISELDTRIKKGHRAIFVIVTDGHENASEIRDPSRVKALIDEKERAGWRFVYLGANQDSWGASAGMGLARTGVAYDFDATDQGIQDAMRGMGARVKSFRHSVADYDLSAAAMPRRIDEVEER